MELQHLHRTENIDLIKITLEEVCKNRMSIFNLLDELVDKFVAEIGGDSGQTSSEDSPLFTFVDLLALALHHEILAKFGEKSTSVALEKAKSSTDVDFGKHVFLKYKSETNFGFLAKVVQYPSVVHVGITAIDVKDRPQKLYTAEVTADELVANKAELKAALLSNELLRKIMARLVSEFANDVQQDPMRQGSSDARRQRKEQEMLKMNPEIEIAEEIRNIEPHPFDHNIGGYGPALPRQYEPGRGNVPGEDFLVGPGHAIFGPGGGLRIGGGRGREPPNGARFDPFGPPPGSGFDVGDFSRPNRDHSRPPGMDHMYL